ncbi:MAG TPA: tryptophan--tRNA ligase [Candidatus Omnitrophota bacterium]|nr:tryptophan--tRNA ligase [Candidatus Omnitrophota bacterium]
MDNLLADNEKLVKEFGASRVSNLKDFPDFYTFNNDLIYSHRDFDKFFKAIKNGEKCAIVSGFNASGTIHLGHKPVFDTNLYFQKKYGIPVFIPISDDESYVAGKVKDQKEALKYSLELSKELLAYGFDPHKTYFIIDQIYTNIYNLAIKLSKKVNLSEIKATYGYKNEENIGLHFYPAIQSAHILFPQEKLGIKHVLVPIGPDEDAHIRICRDIAPLFGLNKPSILHITFLPGVDGEKMSKSKNNAIFLKDDAKTITKKINGAYSGGQKTVEEHRKLGGNPEVDIAYQYLSKFFLEKEESKKLFENYKKGEILSGEIKGMLSKKMTEFASDFQKRLKNIKEDDVMKCILTNEKNIDILFKKSQ